MTRQNGKRAALLLDRDGVINEDRGYVHRMEDFAFMPGVFELVREARQRGMAVMVVTNQSGIGRGLYSEADFASLTGWMMDRFAEAGAPIDRVYHCPYHPTAGQGQWRADHPWRKPAPGMLLQAAEDFDLDLSVSAMIGDNSSDMQAAQAAGVGCRILIGLRTMAGCYNAADLPEAKRIMADWLDQMHDA
ncbi:HAD family hydrolase [Novosphingobium sp.]|uniref:D-glycero-alpha-D-manno-heptose-1,7-bisphosphate 7-phosphatase n=1 Tax=Novosphingobium sp. TaxID=1874826 RepID=UPI0031D1E5D0